MNIPSYLIGAFQETYHQLLNQTLAQGIGNYGFQITNLTAAEITSLTGMNASPVLPAGTMFFDTTNVAWKGISVAAVPGASNATIVTFTVT